MDTDDSFVRLALHPELHRAQPGGCLCPECVPSSFGYAASPFGLPMSPRSLCNIQSHGSYDPYSTSGGYTLRLVGADAPLGFFTGYPSPPPDQTHDAFAEREAERRERRRRRRKTAERERLFELEGARLRKEQEQHQLAAEFELYVELEEEKKDDDEEAHYERIELEAPPAEMKPEDKIDKRQARKEKCKSFLKSAWNEVSGANARRAYDEYVENERRNSEPFRRSQKEGDYLPDGKHVVPENKHTTAPYAIKPGEKSPLNLRADMAVGNLMRSFGMKAAR